MGKWGFIMKHSYKIYTVLVMFLFTVFGVFTFIMPEREYSENENRYLNLRPKFDIQSFVETDYQEKLEKASNDQFPLRDSFMSMSTDVKKKLGAKDVGGVYISKDNYYITKVTDSDVSKSDYMKNLGYVQYFSKISGLDSKVLLVPSTGTILSDKLPKYAQMYDADAMYKMANVAIDNADVIDIREAFRQQSDALQLYFKTDHHWTLEGAYIAYCEYCESADIQQHSYGSFVPEKVSKRFKGTLYSKALDKDAEYDDIYAVPAGNFSNVMPVCDGRKMKGIYDVSKLDEKDKYAYFFGGNYGRVDIKTGSTSENKLLVVKDSFANCFVPFLFEYYSDITMIDLRYYSESMKELLDEEEYTNLLFLFEMSNFASDKNLMKLTK